jgi:hypothetical protein
MIQRRSIDMAEPGAPDLFGWESRTFSPRALVKALARYACTSGPTPIPADLPGLLRGRDAGISGIAPLSVDWQRRFDVVEVRQDGLDELKFLI